MPHRSSASSLIALVHGIQAVYEDAIWLVWYERGVWEKSRAAAAELNLLEKILKECYDVIDLVTLAAIERFGEGFRTDDKDALVVLRSVMAELDQSMLGPVQRGPSQRQFRKGSLKPTSHLMRLAKSNAQKVVGVLEDVNEALLRKHSPRLTRRRSGSWVPTSQEAQRASMAAIPRLRRTSSVQMEVGSLAERYSSAANTRRASNVQGPLTRSSHVALARQYSTRGTRKSSLFFTDSINVTTGGRNPNQLSIQIQRGGHGPLNYTVNVPAGASAAIDGTTALKSTDREKVTVFHNPFASGAQGNVNITIDLSNRRSKYVPAGSFNVQRRDSKSLPASPTSSLEQLREIEPLFSGRDKPRKSMQAHKRNFSHHDQPGHFDTRVRHSIRTSQFSDYSVSPATRGVLSPSGRLQTASPRSLGSPAFSFASASMSPGPRTPALADALSAQAKDTDSIITTSSFGSSVMSYLRRSSSRASRALSLHSTANGPVPDLISVKSADTRLSAVSPISEGQITPINEGTEVSALTPRIDPHRRSSSIDTLRSQEIGWQPQRVSIHSTSRHRRHSTSMTSPSRTFYDERQSIVSPLLPPNEPATEGPVDPQTDSSSGGVRLSMLSARSDLESRTSTPVPSPWNDYLGFCAGAFWAQAGLVGAMLRKRIAEGESDAAALPSPSTLPRRTYLACSNRRCAFTASDADAVPLLEARGVRVRPRFLIKSHVEQPAAGMPLFRCMLCALAKRAAGQIQGVDALLAHLGSHCADAEQLGDEVLRDAHCVAGRRAGEYEGFDVNLLPAAARDSTPSDSLRSPASGIGHLSGIGVGEAVDGRGGGVLETARQLRTSRRDAPELFFDH